MGIGAALASRAKWPPAPSLKPCINRRIYLCSALLAASALAIPWLTRQWLVERNAYYLAFFANPPPLTN
jgi:hypothetical protein